MKRGEKRKEREEVSVEDLTHSVECPMRRVDSLLMFLLYLMYKTVKEETRTSMER